MTLHDFIALPHRFRWGGVGGDDCTTFCATWIDHATGIDPADGLRGTYRDADGANALVSQAGGLVAFLDGKLLPLGHARTDDPQDGDIGVVVAPVGVGEGAKYVSAIRFGPLWLVLAPSGVASKKLDHVAAWRLQV